MTIDWSSAQSPEVSGQVLAVPDQHSDSRRAEDPRSPTIAGSAGGQLNTQAEAHRSESGQAFRAPRTASNADPGDMLVQEWSGSGRRSARASQGSLCAHVRMQRFRRSRFAQRLDIRQGYWRRRHLAQMVKRADHTVVAVMRRSGHIGLLARLRTVGMLVAAMGTASRFSVRMRTSGRNVQRIAGNHHRCVGDGRENGRRLSDRKAHHALGRRNASGNSDPTRQSRSSIMFGAPRRVKQVFHGTSAGEIEHVATDAAAFALVAGA